MKSSFVITPLIIRGLKISAASLQASILACSMAFTVLFANIFSLLIQKWEDKTNKRKLQKLLTSIDNENGVC